MGEGRACAHGSRAGNPNFLFRLSVKFYSNSLSVVGLMNAPTAAPPNFRGPDRPLGIFFVEPFGVSRMMRWYLAVYWFAQICNDGPPLARLWSAYDVRLCTYYGLFIPNIASGFAGPFSETSCDRLV